MFRCFPRPQVPAFGTVFKMWLIKFYRLLITTQMSYLDYIDHDKFMHDHRMSVNCAKSRLLSTGHRRESCERYERFDDPKLLSLHPPGILEMLLNPKQTARLMMDSQKMKPVYLYASFLQLTIIVRYVAISLVYSLLKPNYWLARLAARAYLLNPFSVYKYPEICNLLFIAPFGQLCVCRLNHFVRQLKAAGYTKINILTLYVSYLADVHLV